jgi:hypothetical protein
MRDGGRGWSYNQLAYQEANEMLTTRIRTTIIALVASSGFAAASMVPAVSQASKNTGAYSKSVEAMKGNACHFLLEQFNESLFKLRQDEKSGASDAQIKQDRDGANGMLGEGFVEGCAWALEVPPVSPTSGIVAPVGAIQASPETVTPVRSATAAISPLVAK